MSATYRWNFSYHARKRLAKRLGLLMDVAAEREISKALNEKNLKIVSASNGRLMIEIKVFGKPIVAVCCMETRGVVTFLPAGDPFNSRNRKVKRASKFRPKGSSGSEEE